ncbi:MAG: hypothetical protein IT355_13460 [Gemmatimonadaceae bacterium]|nr:hypothetical protein [Gemmatimonadaceae bacterium]
MTVRRRSLVQAVTAVLLLGSCTAGNSGKGDPVEPPGSVAIMVATPNVTLQAGSDGTVGITIARSGAFTGAVSLTSSGAPSGVTVSFAPATIAPGETVAVATLRTTAATATGPFALTIATTGLAGGATATPANVTVTVTAAPTGSVAIAASPALVAIVAGGAAGTAAIAITRTAPFAGAVDLDVSNVPAGLTATATPATGIAGTSATLSVRAAATLAPATYPLIVTASGEGISKSADTIDVAVEAPVSTGIAVTYCAPDAPIWVAQQDGAGAWTRVLPTTGSTYHINFTTGRGGLAVVDTTGSVSALGVRYLTVEELTAYASSVNIGRCGTKTVFVPSQDLGALISLRASLGHATGSGSGGTITIRGVAAGPQVLLGTRTSVGFAPRLAIRRSVSIADGGTAAFLDFNGPESFDPDSATMTVTGMSDSETGSGGVYFTGSQGSARSPIQSLNNHGRVTRYYGLQGSRLLSGELQMFQTSVLSSDQRSRRTVARYFRSVATTSAVIGPALPTPTITRIESGAFARGRATFSSQPEYNRWAQASFSTGARVNTMLVTAAFAGASLPTTWDLQMPDLSAASGWNDAWAIAATGELLWEVTAAGGSLFRLPPAPADGARGILATRSNALLPADLRLSQHPHAWLPIP